MSSRLTDVTLTERECLAVIALIETTAGLYPSRVAALNRVRRKLITANEND